MSAGVSSFAGMSESSSRPEGPASRENQQHGTDAEDAVVPVIPVWLSDWGALILGPAALVALLAIVGFGQAHGAVYGWVLLAVAACVTAALWGWGYSRRRQAAQARRDRSLYGRLEMAAVDRMGGREFEQYCVDLLPRCGYPGARPVGDIKDKRDVDIIASTPDGALLAIECKRQKIPVYPKVVNALLGAITAGPYQGRMGMVISSARATRGAKAAAERAGIMMVDRPVLQNWIGQLKTQLGPGSQARGMRPVAKVAVAVLGCAAVVLAVTFQVAGSPRSAAAVRVRPAAVPAPGSVVREYFAAISRHDWPQVWQLGGKNLGSGPYASYTGMISAYRLSQRDVLTAVHASGESVTGRFLAYETTGTIQAYDFSLTIRAGTITAGHQTLLATSYSHN